MVTSSPSARPGWFRAVAALLLLWNLFGVAMFLLQYSMSPDMLASLTEGQRQLYASMPGWMWVAYAVAVAAGALGTLMLLLGRRIAVPLLWLSLVAVVVQFSHSFMAGGAVEVLGAAQALPFPAFIIAVVALQVWLARRASVRGWLR